MPCADKRMRVRELRIGKEAAMISKGTSFRRPMDGSMEENARLTEVLIENILQRLAKRDWSLKMLADESGVPYETVKKLISHKIQRPSFHCIWQIAGALGCSTDALTGNPSPADDALRRVAENVFRLSKWVSELEAILGHDFCREALNH